MLCCCSPICQFSGALANYRFLRLLCHDVTATPFGYDGLANSGIVNVVPYSVQIFSQKNTVEPCIADLSGDGIVNVPDILAIIGAWGTPNADITGDNITNVSDLLVVIGEFGPCP